VKRSAQRRWYAKPGSREKSRQWLREWRIANRDRYLEQKRQRRARELAAAITVFAPDLLPGKLAYWGYRCWIKGPRCTVEPETWDHVKPLGKCGPHMLANLRPACQSCNSSKGDRWPFPTARPSAAG
jgi:5-methylcytosine-specific restriction endonuclease McrA